MTTDPKVLLEVAEALSRLRAPWFVAGGWAIDLFLGRVTRPHGDIDISILRRDQQAAREALAPFPLRKVIPHRQGLMNRGRIAPWAPGERLELPIHQINVYRADTSILADADARGVDSAHSWWFQLMLAESDRGDWVYRRNPAVRRPLAAIGLDPLWGLPYLAPEIVLLFKSRHMLAHDREDFRNALPALGAPARAWLRDAVAANNPYHDWLGWL
jgi:Aminoglycoside-2''-adenylyltransferase